MIKAASLTEARSDIFYRQGESITLQTFKESVSEKARELGIPVEFEDDQIKHGGMFSSETEECIVMFHPGHRNDYFRFCVRLSRQGTYAFVSVSTFGSSSELTYAQLDEMNMNMIKKSWIGRTFFSTPNSKKKLEEERNYYRCIHDILNEIEKQL